MSAANVGAVRATALVVLAFCIVPVGTAHARLVLWPQWGSWWGDHAPLRQSHRPRRAEPKSAKQDQAQDAPNGPLQIIISIADQRISVYDNGGLNCLTRDSQSPQRGVSAAPGRTGSFRQRELPSMR